MDPRTLIDLLETRAEEFADEVGADGFAEDAGAAAEVAKSIVGVAQGQGESDS